MDRRTFMSLAFGAAATGWRDLARAEELAHYSGASKPRTMPLVSCSDTRGPPPR
jgi:hypothetical protein